MAPPDCHGSNAGCGMGKVTRVGQQANTRVEVGRYVIKSRTLFPKRTSRQSHVPRCSSSNVRFPYSEGTPFYTSTPPVLSAHGPSTRALRSRVRSLACEPAAGFVFLREKASVAEHVHAGVEDLSVGGTADTGDEERHFVEEADDPAGWVVVC